MENVLSIVKSGLPTAKCDEPGFKASQTAILTPKPNAQALKVTTLASAFEKPMQKNTASQEAGIIYHQKGSVNEKLATIFISIGIPAHVAGYHYLREAVKLASGNFVMVNCITTKLYPLVAAHFNTSACKVERGIRNAIELAWNKGKIINLNAIFGIEIYDENYKPSSGELIALLAEKIYLDS